MYKTIVIIKKFEKLIYLFIDVGINFNLFNVLYINLCYVCTYFFLVVVATYFV